MATIVKQVVIEQEDFESLERAIKGAMQRLDELESSTSASYFLSMVRNQLFNAAKLIGVVDNE